MSSYYVDEIDGVFFTDRTAATDEEFRSRIAPFEAAPTPPEIVEARVVEEVARAMYGAASYEAPSWRPMWDDLDEVREQTWLSLAAAAVAAAAVAQDGGAEDAVRRLLRLIAHDLRLHTAEWPLAEQFARRLDAVSRLAPQAGDGAR